MLNRRPQLFQKIENYGIEKERLLQIVAKLTLSVSVETCTKVSKEFLDLFASASVPQDVKSSYLKALSKINFGTRSLALILDETECQIEFALDGLRSNYYADSEDPEMNNQLTAKRIFYKVLLGYELTAKEKQWEPLGENDFDDQV